MSANTPKLYLAQCGFYPKYSNELRHEEHMYIFVVATDPEDAVRKVRRHSVYDDRGLHAHVDGLQEIAGVDGYLLSLSQTAAAGTNTIVAIESPWKIEQAIKEKDGKTPTE